MTGTFVANVGAAQQVRVDAHGDLHPHDTAWLLDWWIGGDDRWHLPATEAAVRQTLVDGVPVVRTAVRVPGGDAVQHVYAVGGPGDLVVIDIANESPAPFVLALVVRDAHQLSLDRTRVLVDGHPRLLNPRAPSRWALSRDGSTLRDVTAGAARDEPFPSVRDRAGRLEAAFLQPVAHRTHFRAAVTLGDPVPDRLDLASLPGPADAARGWRAHLERGLRVELPDPALAVAVTSARAAILLAAARRPVDPATIAALEDWGFDAEATAAWPSLGWRRRRAAARRPSGPTRWADVAATPPDDSAGLLLNLRALLAHEDDNDTITLMADLPPTWRGHGLEVHDAPTRHGKLSYAVRWHGSRPALLWDAPPGVQLRAPGLDPAWRTGEPRGDVLLRTRVAC